MKRIITFALALVVTSIIAAASAATSSVRAEAVLASRAYAIKVYGDSWGSVTSKAEVVSFDVDNPQEMSVEHTFDNKTVRAAAYVDGTYYMVESDDGFVAYRFSAYDTATRQYRVIREYRTADLENALMFQCMAYDASTGNIYAYAFDIRNSSGDGDNLDIPFELFTIDPSTGSATLVGENDMQQILTLAADASGYLYGIDTQGTLWGVNKRNGRLSGEEGYAPIEPSSLQSMAFDEKDNLMYWAGFTTNNGSGNGFFGKFGFSDDEGWLYSKVADNADNAELIGLWIDTDPLPKDAPAAVQGLAMTPAAQGGLQATLSWVNPTENIGGAALDGQLTVNVYRDGTLLKTVGGQQPGQAGQTVVDEAESGVKGYTVAAANAAGDGRTVYTEGFVGRDTPGAVTALAISKDADDALTATWSAPATGTHGGWFDASALRYNVTRLPDNVLVAENTAQTSLHDTGIAAMQGYSYKVTPVNADGEGTSLESAIEFAGQPLQMPFACDFTTDALVRLWKVYDEDGDGQTWFGTKNSVESFMKYFPDAELSPELSADDWFISAPMRLEAGKTYLLQYSARSQGELFPVKYNVTLGTADTPTAQTTVVKAVDGFTNMSMEHQQQAFTVPQTGSYSLGFQACNRVQLNIKDVSIEERHAVELAAVSLAGTSVPTVGEKNTYTVHVANNGYESARGYAVQLVDEGGNVLAQRTDAPVIEPFGDADVDVEWTPEAVGKAQIRARVAAEGDADEANNTTEPMKVNVLDGGKWVDAAKDGMQLNNITPFHVSSNYSIGQAVYDADSLGCGKRTIKGLMFYYNATADVEPFPVRIYLANTDVENFTSKVIIPESYFTLVYDGLLSVPQGETSTMVLFDTPFEYDGGNLALMTRKDNGAKLSGVYFMSQSILNDRDRHSWCYYDTEAFDFPTDVTRFYKDRPSVSFFVNKDVENGIGTPSSSADVEVGMSGKTLVIAGGCDAVGVYNIGGQLVREASHASAVSLDGCNAGIYIVKIARGGDTATKRVVVK